MKLLLATGNTHKVRELRTFLKNLNFDVYTFHDFPEYQAPPEDGLTFEENAIKKATDAAQKLNMHAIADDSGLVVPALKGAPGVFSARYAGPNACDKDNRKKLLAEMANLSGMARSAYFECAIAFASPEKLIKCVKGTAEGMVAEEERGGSGFGYDPLFIKHDYNKTFAEMPEETKNKISHRGKALQKLLLVLGAL